MWALSNLSLPVLQIMRKVFLLIAIVSCLSSSNAQIGVDSTKRFLVDSVGNPFFWMADTGWELFHRLSREEAVHYLDIRKAQQFNVIMAVALAEVDGLRHPNFYGDLPFSDISKLEWDTTPGNDPLNPEEYDYWDHVDYVIDEAGKRGMYIGLLPTWGDKVVPGGAGPVVFTDESSAYGYAKKLADRYRDCKNVIWILGGDRPALYVARKGGKADSVDYRPVWRGMAKAIQDVFGNDVFIAYHPGNRTSQYFKEEDGWLSINSIQSGHTTRDFPVWDFVIKDLKSIPKRPFMDMEPCYEDHPVFPWDNKWTREERGYFSDYDVRSRIYRSVFAGSCGAVYGHHQVWQFLDTARNAPIWVGDTIIGWLKALHSDGANQMKHLKNLICSQSDFYRNEDSLLIVSDRGANYKDKLIATRQADGNYAFIYLPQPLPLTVDLDRLRKGNKKVCWLDPATGKHTRAKGVFNSGEQTFVPPNTEQPDWVLVIEWF